MTDADLPPEADDPRPWLQPGAVRRDCEPHRGGLLRGLGIVSLVVPFAGLVISPAIGIVAGVSLGLTIWVLAGRDLAKMDAGVMDPNGRRQTRSSRRWALAGVLVSVGLLVLVVAAVVALFTLLDVLSR
jgi:hypothetical protein